MAQPAPAAESDVQEPTVRETAASLLPIVLVVLALVLLAWSIAWLP